MANNQDPRNMFFQQRQQYTESTKQQPKQQGAHEPSTGDYSKKLEEMKALAAKYQREGEGQLVKDIVNSVLEQKAMGKLTNEQLVEFANRVSPLLNAEQKSRLGALLEQLLKL